MEKSLKDSSNFKATGTAERTDTNNALVKDEGNDNIQDLPHLNVHSKQLDKRDSNSSILATSGKGNIKRNTNKRRKRSNGSNDKSNINVCGEPDNFQILSTKKAVATGTKQAQFSAENGAFEYITNATRDGLPTVTKRSEVETVAERCNARWENMFQRLLDFREKNGHCLVPNRYAQDPQLGAWVATQRRFYKMKIRGNSKGGLTPERETKLVEAGFEWTAENSRCVPWNTRFVELLEFVAKYGHAQVPIGWKNNVPLSNWVSTQRQEYKASKKGGKSSALNDERIKLLTSIGFIWVAQRGVPRGQRKASDAVSPLSFPVEVNSAHRTTANNLLRIFRKMKHKKNGGNGVGSDDTDKNDDTILLPTSLGSVLTVLKKTDPNSKGQKDDKIHDKKRSAAEIISQEVAMVGVCEAGDSSAAPTSAHLPVALLPSQSFAHSPNEESIGFVDDNCGLSQTNTQSGLQNTILSSLATAARRICAPINAGFGNVMQPFHFLQTRGYTNQIQQQQQLMASNSLLAAMLATPQAIIRQQPRFSAEASVAGTTRIPNSIAGLPNFSRSNERISILRSMINHQLNATHAVAIPVRQEQMQQQHQLTNLSTVVDATLRTAARRNDCQNGSALYNSGNRKGGGP